MGLPFFYSRKRQYFKIDINLYEDLPFKFRPSPLEDIEADLLEAQAWYHDQLRKAEERLRSYRVNLRHL